LALVGSLLAFQKSPNLRHSLPNDLAIAMALLWTLFKRSISLASASCLVLGQSLGNRFSLSLSRCSIQVCSLCLERRSFFRASSILNCLHRSSSIKFFQDRPLPCYKHVGATAAIFVAAQPTGTSSERTMDCCCYCHVKTSFKPGRKCRSRSGLGRSSKDLNRGSCPDYPARRGD
jgi:hypothetical protein